MIDLLHAATSGIGVYSIPEAAQYAKMKQATLRTWFYGTKQREALRGAEIESPDLKAITFLEFVEAVAIRSLRVDYQVPLQTIRQAINNASDKYGIRHPFAHRDHKTVLIGRDLYIFLPEDATNPVQISGKAVGQKSFRTCIEAYMKELDFDESGLARLYRAYSFGGEDIVMNPTIHFGEPIVKAHGYTAETLYRAAIAEGGIAQAARLYEVPENAVEAAYRYFNQELGTAA
jgi:uncharacterized protein (DUF433 family)